MDCLAFMVQYIWSILGKEIILTFDNDYFDNNKINFQRQFKTKKNIVIVLR